MTKFIIHSRKPLNGKVKIGGAKNAVLPLMAATLLTNETCEIHNTPNISDVKVLSEIMTDLGSVITHKGDVLTIDNKNLHYAELDFEKLRKIRSSILIIGPMLARFGQARFIEPGGCKLGNRSIDTHLHAFETLGAKTEFDGERYHITTDGFTGTRMVLDEMSVTGTANAVMSAVLAHGTTEIRLAAAEPENINLMEALVSMGAKISGIGTHNVVIEGVSELHGASITVITDRIEAATFAVAAVITNGDLLIDGYIRDHQDVVTQTLTNIGAHYEMPSDHEIHIFPSDNLKAFKIRTDIYPGFPTDMQALFGALMTKTEGTSYIHETMYDGRLAYLEELNKLGANCKILDIHRAEIIGPTNLHGAEVTCPDIRGGAGILLAALSADGETIINNAYPLERGYADINIRLQALGIDIEKQEG